MADFTPYQRGHSRVFILEGGPRPDHAPIYMGCMAAGGVSQDFGGAENIECPSEDAHNQWDVVGEIQTEAGRATTTLTGLYALDVESMLLRLAKRRCRADVVIVGGDCTDPSAYNFFRKAKHLEGGRLEHHETDEEGSLKSGDNAAVNESADVSARYQYEVMPMAFETQANSLVTEEIRDVVICDSPSCGDCSNESSGCAHIYAIQGTANVPGGGGSPAGMGNYLVYTLDEGKAWNSSYIDSLAGGLPRAVVCLRGYIVVLSSAPNELNYVTQEALDATGDETWLGVTTGLTVGTPMGAWSTGRYMFIANTQGYVYGTDDPSVGVTALNAATATDPDSGVAITDDFYAVHALNEEFAVVVGENGAIVKTENGGVTWAGVSRPVALGVHLTSVWLISKTVWWVGTSSGRLYYTTNGGTSFTEKTFPGSGSGYVYDLSFSNDAVGYMSHSTALVKGRILRTHSGGGGSGDNGGWYIMPESGHGSMPVNDRFRAVAACRHDVNMVVAGGLSDTSSDGILVLGED